MYKLIQKNQKKFLAIFVVLLMIVFLLPSGAKNGLGRGGDQVVGTVYGQSVYGRDLGEAKADLEMLRHEEFEPLLELGSSPGYPNPYAFKQFNRQEELYVLLQREARHLGIVITSAQAEQLAKQYLPWDHMSRDDQEAVVPAVQRFMLVQTAFQRAADGVKVSQPLLRHVLAEDFQLSKVDLVEFKGEDFANQVPAPTPEQIHERYDRYADVLPQPGNPFNGQPPTPGYKLPDRVKLQYLELPHDAVVKAVLDSLTHDQRFPLEMAAMEFYNHHGDDPEFHAPAPPATAPSTGPATLPATGPATGPTTGPATASSAPATAPATVPVAAATQPAGPTTRPFKEVQAALEVRLVNEKSLSSDEAVEAVRQQVARREEQLRGEMHDELVAAWKEWSAAHPDGPPATGPAEAAPGAAAAPAPATTAPTTSPAASPTTSPATLPVEAYPSLEFLDAFANRFEARNHVRPMVTSLSKDWLTRDDLEKLGSISGASAGGTDFSSFVFRSAAPPPTTGPTTAPAAGAATNPTTSAATPGPATQAVTPPATQPAATQPAATEPAATRPAGERLRLFEPSPVLKDYSDNAYVVRVTAFDPAHKPPLEEALTQIVKDLRAAAGMDRAREPAQQVVNLAGKYSIASAAKSFEHPVLHAGPFSPKLAQANLSGIQGLIYASQHRSEVLRGYNPDESDLLSYLQGVQSLLKSVTPSNPHPTGLIELPVSHKVLAAQVTGSSAPWPAEFNYTEEIALDRAVAETLAAGTLLEPKEPAPSSLIARWFNFDDATARTKYVSEREKKAKAGS